MFRQWRVQLGLFLMCVVFSLVFATGDGVAQKKKGAEKSDAQWRAEVQSLKNLVDKHAREIRELRQDLDKARRNANDNQKDFTKESRENAALKQQLKAARDQATDLQVQVQTLRQRNTQLEGQVQKLAEELAKLRATGKGVGKAPALNPPADRVEGTVTAVQREGLLELSIGSDAGLKTGHTLEVFRLKAQGKYLGVVEIIQVTPKRSVGRIRSTTSGPIEVGDRVASRILE
jgi:hypothetical protein